MQYCLINGQQENKIAINDRALAYGDGIFTTAKIHHGQVEFLSAHLNRLITGCRYLGFELNTEQLQEEIALALQHSKNLPCFSHGVLKVIVSAGSGGRGYSRNGLQSEHRIITLHDLPQHYSTWAEQGINLVNGKLQLGLNPLLKGLKHLNRLEQVMIRAELDKTLADDLLVSDIQGYVIESSCANVFWFKDNVLYTPIINDAGILGLYRQHIIKFDPQVKEVHTTYSDIKTAEAMFICNSVMGITPVKTYQQKLLDISKVTEYKKRFLASLV